MTLFVLWSVVALFAVSVLAVALAEHPVGTRLTYGASLVVSLILVAAALAPVDAGSVILPLGLPWLGAHFRVDALARFFLGLVNFGGAAASLYALGYGRHERDPGRVLPFFPVFLAGMNLVIVADDAYSFLFAWELMSLASWGLVMAAHRTEEGASAGFIYLLMASFSALALLLAFGLLAGPAGSYAFSAIRASHVSPGLAALVLALALLGAGSKAGLVPLHVWLPQAHPAAPTHVSALMSGVMTKVAIYALIRIVFDLVGAPAWWWSLPVLALGGVTAALGILYALMEADLKRVLAYSTIENVGIIFIGLGLALAFRANAMPGAAALALTAALFHALNHMLFKSLLFFGSGTVVVATGQRDMERLGGLIHRMPYSSATVLAGCMAISALPPFNGFVSEWLVFQGVLVSPELPQWALKVLVPAVGTLLALAAALAGACFVRAFGATYLGRPRTADAERASETDRWSLAAMGTLAVLCLFAGVFPGVIIDRLAPAVAAVVGGRMPPQAGIAWLSIVPIADSRSSYNGLLIFLFVTASAMVTATSVHRLASRAVRRAPFWDCGYAGLAPVAQYSAASLAQPIRRVFGSVAFSAGETVAMPPPGDTRPASLRKVLRDPLWEFLYAPVAGAVERTAGALNRLQFLTIRRYLVWVFSALIVLLMVLGIWG